eukprot:193519-Chlamydomonas_euryale.AAC.1
MVRTSEERAAWGAGPTRLNAWWLIHTSTHPPVHPACAHNTQTHTHARTHAHVCARMDAHTHARMDAHTHARMDAHMHARMDT